MGSGGRHGNGGAAGDGHAGAGGHGATGGISGSGGAGGRVMCDGLAGRPCPTTGQFCDHSTGICNVPDGAGTCATKPTACTQVSAPVCGCDGHTYDNDCLRQAVAVSKMNDGPCNPADCPAAAPTAGTACPTASLTCKYTVVTDPTCFRQFTCGPVLTWSQPATACAASSF